MITKISYYELLELVKNKKAPEKVDVQLAGYKEVTYKASYDGIELSCYLISNRDDQDENYHFYLAENFIESSMFDRCITILDGKTTKIEELKINDGKVNGTWENGNNYCYTLSAPQTVIIHKINELTRTINFLLEKEENE